MPFDRESLVSLKSVCVYCGSSNKVDPAHKEAARAVGHALAEHKLNVVYGGGHVGLMGILADAALNAGGTVTGIIPEHLYIREVQHSGLTKLHVVDSMHTRKKMMVEQSDAFLVLPGGLGTLDETFEVLTWKQLGLHDKPIVIYNNGGFWTPLLGMIDHIIATGFAPAGNRDFYRVASNIDEMFKALAAPNGPKSDPLTKWI